MSVAGGLPRGVERAVVHRCDAFQIFAKNGNQWRGRIVPPDEVREFRTRVETAGIHPVVSHASYLINLAAVDDGLRQQSIDAMGDELDRAEALGLYGVVLHPGAYTSGRESLGIEKVGDALTSLLNSRREQRTMVFLEHTAGQGTSLGATFEQIAGMIARIDGHPRVGVCLDTCHLVASGYDIVSTEGYADTFIQFERLIGIDRLKVFHLNDSKRALGSRVDRHEHIGQGVIGVEPFRRILNDARFRHLPMLLETPKGDGKATGPIQPDPEDVKNLELLRSLLKPADGRRGVAPPTNVP